MNSEIKQKWVNALRSGEYKQSSRGFLCVTSEYGAGYCCLGVLCDLYVKEHNKEWAKEYKEWTKRYNGRILDFEGEDQYPPQSVVEWAGLPDKNPSIEFSGEIDDCEFEDPELSELNDEGISFNTIAGLIEQYL